jgi:hypothetical protein
MAAKKNVKGNVFVQKRAQVLEFCAWDRTTELAVFDIPLGDVNIRDGMLKRELIAKLENAVKLLKAHPGDVFVVQ